MTDYSKDIERYLNGEMTPAERHALEKRSLSDPFLADALEGAELITPADFEKDVNTLNTTINKSAKKESKKFLVWGLRIAAGLLILFIATYLIINLGDEIKSTPELSDIQPLQKADTNQFKTDSSTTIISNDQLALAEEKLIQKKEIVAERKSTEKKYDTFKTPIIEAEKAVAPAADATGTEQDAEEIATETIAPAKNISRAEVEEKKMSPISASEAVKEAEPVVSSRVRGTNTDRNAKKSFADQGAIPQLPASTISGVVTSAEDGSPLPGVNVVLKGTTIGTITDVEGKFKLDSATIASTLVYSFIGLRTKEVSVTNFNPLNVALNADVTQLSEVVVTGYGYSNNNNETTPTVDLAHPEIGNRAYRKHLEENIIYPQSAIDNKIEGRVTVEFFVETDGSLSDFTIVKGIGGGCDEELIRLIRQGPRWVPTKKDNQPIRDKARVRLNFQLPGK